MDAFAFLILSIFPAFRPHLSSSRPPPAAFAASAASTTTTAAAAATTTAAPGSTPTADDSPIESVRVEEQPVRDEVQAFKELFSSEAEARPPEAEAVSHSEAAVALNKFENDRKGRFAAAENGDLQVCTNLGV